MAIALAALVVSIVAIITNVTTRKRMLYLDLESRLTSPDSQEGRDLMVKGRFARTDDIATFHKRRPDEFRKINRVLSLYNTLGTYVRLKYVEREVVLLHWGPTIASQWDELEKMIRYRRRDTGPEKFAGVVWLAQLSGVAVKTDLTA